MSNIFCQNHRCQENAHSTCIIKQYQLKGHALLLQGIDAVITSTCIFCQGALPNITLLRLGEEEVKDEVKEEVKEDHHESDAADEPQWEENPQQATLPDPVPDPVPEDDPLDLLPTRIFVTLEGSVLVVCL